MSADAAPTAVLRRAVPAAILPLAAVACGLAASPWLRAYPSGVLAVPLFGAAVLSLLVPLVVVGGGLRRLWATALVDLVLAVFYELLVTLRAPVGFDQLWSGVVHGPSQILTFALPLVSPRSLLVVPVALTWLGGAVVGECLARAWHSVVPYAVLLVTFGLAYAATTRAITSSTDGRRYDTLLAGLLLLTLLLVRVAQAWVAQDRGAETTQADSRLPLRSVAIGAAVSVVVALAAAGAVQADGFAGPPSTASRMPPLDSSELLTPVSFVNSLRPTDPKAAGARLFTLTVNRPTSNYVSLATVDVYDGSGWTFDRTFRPSGGVVPAADDPTLRPGTPPVTQQYSIADGPLTEVPWMPYLDRASRVSGVGVDIDADSGMIVPARHLRSTSEYSVTSRVAGTPFTDLPATDVPSLSGDATDVQLPGSVFTQLTPLISTLAAETGVSSATPLAYLQAVARDFRSAYGLSGGPAVSTSPASSAAPTSARSSFGGTSFADVLASIRQNRSASPEQYATLMTLIARRLGVRARLVAGFRIPTARGGAGLAQGRYVVTGSDAWSWVQIPVTGVGWVTLDPSPSTYTATAPSSANPAPTGPGSPTPSRSVQLSTGANSTGGGHAAAPPSSTGRDSAAGAAAVAWIVAGAVVLLVLLVLAFLLLRKRVRARRRRVTGDPRSRLVGAWQETLDMLAEAGLPELAACTGTEVARATGARFGEESATQARLLGTAANTAIFGPGSLIGPGDADAAWQAQRTLHHLVRHQLTLGARMSATLRYHRPSANRRPRTDRRRPRRAR